VNQLATAIYNFNQTNDADSLADLKDKHLNFEKLVRYLVSLSVKPVGEGLEGDDPLIEWF
jgi:hypothetical protein